MRALAHLHLPDIVSLLMFDHGVGHGERAMQGAMTRHKNVVEVDDVVLRKKLGSETFGH